MGMPIQSTRAKRSRSYRIVFNTRARPCDVCGKTIEQGDPHKSFKARYGQGHACSLCDIGRRGDDVRRQKEKVPQ